MAGGIEESRGGEADTRENDALFVYLLKQEFAEVKFVSKAPRFSYQLRNNVPTVFLGGPQPNFGLLTLHELGHALSKHKHYTCSVERVKIESEAWERAKTVLLELWKRAEDKECMTINGKDVVLAKILPEWDEDFAQEKLDTYRDWLHAKSRCKKCGLTKYQTEDEKWHCPRCEAFTL